MPVDYHLHTARCGHASGTMEEYLKVAVDKGITEVGFADHIPIYWLPPEQRDGGLAMASEELPAYVVEVNNLQEIYPQLNIKLGLEVDYIPGHLHTARQLIKSLPLDYVLGSVHYVEGWGFDNPDLIGEYKKWDLTELYHKYFELVRQAAASGLFDIIAHTDLIKKFGYRPNMDLKPIYRKLASTFRECGVCVEVNTAGLRVPAGECYPCIELLQMLYRYGVPVTTGSDAHKPEQVGEGLDLAINLIKSVGYTKITVFKNRKRRYIEI
ncbi:histidinol-phosphatase HisJ family protein [Desulfofalx alkaliphila]|uniref:histidinol-phosphatase HisJ family protein n=1 Tax=Desulfofalx alkaliphila TaxID=105483 RepID=UPI0004E16143|nr:histidinol-phosphatase HisJ family protein [Desulfofalx alkaliphila]